MDKMKSNSNNTHDKIIAKPKGVKQQKPIYKNVLGFPKGTDHLKYFERNPHPERMPDELLAFAEAFPTPDLNVNLFQKIHEFEMVKRFLDAQLSDKERKILRMPEKMQQFIAIYGDEDNKKAYAHLRNCFYNYFTTPLDENIRPDIQWIEYPFATKTNVAQKALKELKNNLFNDKAKKKLVEKLQEAGAFGNERKDFYFWNTEPYNWSEISYQSRSVNTHIWPFIVSGYMIDVMPQYIALGDFTINAIPEGYVQPKGDGKYEICVKKMYFFVNDSFNFEDFEFLGSWNLDEIDQSIWSNKGKAYPLYNSDFREFQRHGYGRYFPVLSKLHELENFETWCKEYPFEK